MPGNASPSEIAAELASLENSIQSGEDRDFDDLLQASMNRVRNDLAKPGCQKDFRDVGATLNKLGSVRFSDQGIIRINTDGTPTRRSPGVARYNPITGSINLNKRVNWSNPGSTIVLMGDGSTRRDLLRGQAEIFGVSSVTAREYMDLTILHELSNYNGAIGNPDRGPGVEKAIWWDCIK